MNTAERTIQAKIVAGMGKVRTACRILVVNTELERKSLICRHKLDDFVKIIFLYVEEKLVKYTISTLLSVVRNFRVQ
jgi:hypothetical protein